MSMLVDIFTTGYALGELIRETANERGGGWYDSFAGKQKFFTASYMRQIANLGRTMTPSVFLSHAPGLRALSKFPLDEQRKYETGSVELLIANGETLMADVLSLTKDQVKQVFDGNLIRTIPEQRLWIESEKMKQKIKQQTDLRPIKGAQEWEIRNHRLIVGDVVFTKSQLKKITDQM